MHSLRSLRRWKHRCKCRRESTRVRQSLRAYASSCRLERAHMATVASPMQGTFEELGPFEPPFMAPRRVRLWAPPGLEPSPLRPLLVVFDGQNVFDDAASDNGGWRLHEALAELPPECVAPLVVAVPHGGPARMT